MKIDPSDFIAAFAVVVGIVALVLSVHRQRRDDERRARNGATYQSREKQLETRVALLERDIAGLQRMLTEKQNEIDRLTERIRQLEHGAVAASRTDQPSQRQRKNVLVVGVGSDAALEVDLAALRGVAGLQLAVLRNVSKSSLEALLERHRANGFPVRYLHLAVHASHEGLAFDDGLADGLWLSRHLAGVEVLVLAGCESDHVGDLLSVVPAVISMRDEIENRDASIFSRAFWTAIAQGLDVTAALDEALSRSPSQVSEMVELHL